MPLSHSVGAALSEGNGEKLEVGVADQGGGTSTSSQFRHQSAVGEPFSTQVISSARFRILPGLFGASSSDSAVIPPSDLDLLVLYAKTSAFGETIAAATWQRDNDPLFIWEPPPTGPPVAGYSYALDSAPDEVIDTTDTSFDVAKSALGLLADGKHAFSVQALNTLGNAGKPISLELWVDTMPPQVLSYSPGAGALLKTLSPSVSATVSDAASGVDESKVKILINGSSASGAFDKTSGLITTSGGSWREGANSLELRSSDMAGNAQVPLVWSVTVDTQPPKGTLTINAGSESTTSIYVTLSLSASDATSGLARMLVSNDPLTGFVEEPYTTLRPLWKINPVRGVQTVYVKFIDKAGNVSAAVSDGIEMILLSPDTLITSGPAGFTPERAALFSYMCPESNCLFSYAFDNEGWSEWSGETSVVREALAYGNHYFRVKAAKDVNGTPGIQSDEEDPSPAERTWIVGVEPSILIVPKGPPIKFWRLE